MSEALALSEAHNTGLQISQVCDGRRAAVFKIATLSLIPLQRSYLNEAQLF